MCMIQFQPKNALMIRVVETLNKVPEKVLSQNGISSLNNNLENV